MHNESHSPPVYRGRLAPSPTGLLHLGHAQTFRTARDRASAANGVLVLRNEDLDPQRARPEYAAAMLEDLRWLGIRWQEGPDAGGLHGPYAQSARRVLYLNAWRSLVEQGLVYPCHCTRRELEQSAQAPHETEGKTSTGAAAWDDREALYPGTCRPRHDSLPGSAPAHPAGVNWRLRVPDNERICFDDGRMGPRCYTAGIDFGDFLIWRRDDVPAYQLACVVDDAAMRITEVVRGADLLRSTARQLLLYRALGLQAPRWFHCPLITDAQGRRLAKRSDALTIRALREQGWTPGDVLARAAKTGEQELR